MMFLFGVGVKGVAAIVVAAGSAGGRPGSQQEGPARDAECPTADAAARVGGPC